MKITSIVLYCFLIISCSSSPNYDNQKEIDLIDKMAFSKIITQIETDSLGNTLDTFNIKKYKFDDNQNKRYEEIIPFYGSRKKVIKRYFKSKGDLFYQTKRNEKLDILYTFETQSNHKGQIEKSISTDRRGLETDTTFAFYHYNDKKPKQIVIHFSYSDPEKNNLIKTVNYGTNKKVLNELMTKDKDTIFYKNYDYSNKSLVRKTYTKHQSDRSIYYYNQDENVIKEEVFLYTDSTFRIKFITHHIYNASKERIKSIEKFRNLGNDIYYKYTYQEIKNSFNN